MSDVYKINVSMLKSYESAFKTELNNFNNSTYNTFSSSYLKSCGDNYVRRMTNELQIAYNKLKNSYNNIDKWWTEYNKNIEGLENYLSDSGTAGVISESSVRSSASNLPELQKYNISLAGTFAINPINTTYTTSFLNNSAVSTDLFSTLYTDYEVDEINQIENVEDVGGTISESSTSVLSGVGTWIKTAASNVWNVIKSVGATVGTIFLSVVEGLLQFVGAVIDTLLLAGAVVLSIPLGIVDGVQAIFGATTGYEWESMTKWMWNDVKAEVSKKVVSPAFDKIYESDIGNWLQENTNNFPLFQLFDSIGIMDSENSFDLTRSIVSGIGYVAGIVLLTIATAGLGGAAVGGTSAATATAATTASATTSIVTTVSNLSTQMAVTAGVAGVGKYTQEAWNDGASTFEGLAAGGIGGLWEALQFYVGGKISGLKIFGAKGVVGSVAVSEGKAKVLNGLARVILDAGDGGLEGFANPFMQLIYKDGYYDENGNYVEFLEDQDFAEKYEELFEDNGGWASVATNAEVGGFASLFGEVFDFSKHMKNVKNADNPSYVLKHLKEYSAEEIKIDDILSTRTEDVKKALSKLKPGELAEVLSRVTDSDNLKFILENTEASKLLSAFKILADAFTQKIIDMDPDNTRNISKTVKIEPALKDMVKFDEQNSWKYEQQIKDLASRLGISYEEVYEVLNEKVKELIDTSDFGIRVSNGVLDLILDDGRFKNQFETNTSKGELDHLTRSDVEQAIINVPKDTFIQDRPVYGMCFPEISSKFKNSSDVFVTLPYDVKNYYVDGPGDWYGDFEKGAVCLFKKDQVVDNVSFTLGDSLNFRDNLVASPASNPRFCGGFTYIFEDIDSLDKLKNIKLTELMPGSICYLELHYHGVATHSIDNLEMVIFLSTPDNEIIQKLKSKGIPFKIIN